VLASFAGCAVGYATCWSVAVTPFAGIAAVWHWTRKNNPVDYSMFKSTIFINEDFEDTVGEFQGTLIYIILCRLGYPGIAARGAMVIQDQLMELDDKQSFLGMVTGLHEDIQLDIRDFSLKLRAVARHTDSAQESLARSERFFSELWDAGYRSKFKQMLILTHIISNTFDENAARFFILQAIVHDNIIDSLANVIIAQKKISKPVPYKLEFSPKLLFNTLMALCMLVMVTYLPVISIRDGSYWIAAMIWGIVSYLVITRAAMGRVRLADVAELLGEKQFGKCARFLSENPALLAKHIAGGILLTEPQYESFRQFAQYLDAVHENLSNIDHDGLERLRGQVITLVRSQGTHSLKRRLQPEKGSESIAHAL
jgi:hypothetical protein